MNKRHIETISVAAVSKSISHTRYLSPYIQSDDKEPSWDGHIYIFNDIINKKEDLKGRVPVQVKGKLCKDLTKNEVTYSVNVVDLKNYLSDGGVIFFLVYIDNHTDKIYYSALTPVKLKHYLKDIGAQKSKSITLRVFPEDNNKKIAILENCLRDCELQKSFSRTGFLSIEELQNKDIEDISFQASVYTDKNEINIIDSLLELNEDIYIYAKIKGSKALHPINAIIKSISFPDNENLPISIDGKTYYTFFKKNIDKDKKEILIGDSLKISMLRNTDTIDVSYEPSKMLRASIIDLNFFINAIKAKYFFIDNKKIDFVIPKKELHDFDMTTQVQRLIMLQEIQDLLIALNVDNDINLDTLTSSDYKNIDLLVKSIIKKEPILNLKKGINVQKVKISDLKLLLILVNDQSTSKFEIRDFFNSGYDFYYKDENDNSLRAPVFSYLKKKDYLDVSNIDYEKVLTSYQTLSEQNCRITEIANNDMLQMLLAYDESSPKNTKLLKVAKSLAEWIYATREGNISNEIKKINYLQIISRERDLVENEKQELMLMLENERLRTDIKVATHILLKNKDLARFNLSKMLLDEQNDFKAFPIYNLMESLQ